MTLPVRSSRSRRRLGAALALCAQAALLAAFADAIAPALVFFATRSQAARVNLLGGIELILGLAGLIVWPVARRRGKDFMTGVAIGCVASFALILCLSVLWLAVVFAFSGLSIQ